jgi:hypothetical protein
MMEKKSMGTFRDFARFAYNQFGMRVAILAAYCDREGDPTITLFALSLYREAIGSVVDSSCEMRESRPKRKSRPLRMSKDGNGR